VGKDVYIGDFLHRIKRPVMLDPCNKYKLVTVKLYHKGVVLRREALGSEIKSKMYEVKTGDFILSGIDARNGAFGIVPPELDGAIVTNDFWYFDIDESIVEKYFFLELTSTLWFDEICRKGSDGTTQRIRLQKNKFFNQQIHLPGLEEQKAFITAFRRVKESNGKLNTELTNQQTLLKKLRQQILQDAIEGKLTADWRKQNPDVEPASGLLSRIQVEKAKLVKEGKIKKPKSLPPITEKEKLFELPDGWEWCRLAEVANIGTGATPLTSEPLYYGGIVNWMTSSDTGLGFVRTTKNKITDKALRETNCSVYPVSTLVVAMYGQGKTRGQITELMIDAATNQACATISLYLFSRELNQFIKTHFKKNYVDIRAQAQGGAQPNLNMMKIKTNVIALPPLAEQKMIVTKVEKLVSLCDQLENQIAQNQSNAEKLMQAVLKEAFSGG
jgi:type I restriction enzyme S subunit